MRCRLRVRRWGSPIICGVVWLSEGALRVLRRGNQLYVGSKAAVAVCLAEPWCAAVHEASWPGGLALFPCWCVGWLLLLDLCLTKYSFRLNLLFRQASFYSGFFRSVCSAIGGLADLVGVAC